MYTGWLAMNKKKKAEGLSLSVVVIAILCLLVLVVLVFIFTNRIQLFNKGADDCQGVCVESTYECDDLGGTPRLMKKCQIDGQTQEGKDYCCVKDTRSEG